MLEIFLDMLEILLGMLEIFLDMEIVRKIESVCIKTLIWKIV